MRFMMLMIPAGYGDAEPTAMPSAEAVAAMMKYNERLQKAGALISLDGLQPPAAGTRVTFKGGKVSVMDGPFTESKEFVGGYWMIRASSKAEAVQWATECPCSHDAVIEIRQVHEFTDFPPDVQEAAGNFRELHAKHGHESA